MDSTSSLGRKTEELGGLSKKTQYMVETALLVAVTIIMGNTFLGTIPTPLLKVSIVTVPVALASMLIGPVAGIVCGLAFGINSFIGALNGSSGLLSTLFNINPFGVFVTAIVARVLDAAVTSFVYKFIHKGKLKTASYYITGALMPLLNTAFFMGSLCLFFFNTEFVQGLAANYNATTPMAFVIGMVGVQATIEAVVGCVLGGTLAMVLSKALHRG